MNGNVITLKPVLWTRIQIGSVFRNFVDPDQYSEYGSGWTLLKIAKEGSTKW